uniref:Uncharacterized protein n=1 Tax=Acrobeloides nanus TaxID=290746 RepID=A0A914CZ47_9BILA
MGFPLVVNGIFNSSQYIVQLCVKLLWGGVIMSYLQNRFSQNVSCKISQVFASIFVAAPMILIANLFDHLNEFALLSLLCLIAVGMGIILNGFYTYMLSLSPEHTGLLSSIANILGTIGCVILPYFFVVLKVSKHTQWYMVFTVAGIGQAVTSLLFVLYAK